MLYYCVNGRMQNINSVTVLAKTTGWIKKARSLVLYFIIFCHLLSLSFLLIYLLYLISSFISSPGGIALFEALQKFRDFEIQWAFDGKLAKTCRAVINTDALLLVFGLHLHITWGVCLRLSLTKTLQISFSNTKVYIWFEIMVFLLCHVLTRTQHYTAPCMWMLCML